MLRDRPHEQLLVDADRLIEAEQRRWQAEHGGKGFMGVKSAGLAPGGPMAAHDGGRRRRGRASPLAVLGDLRTAHRADARIVADTIRSAFADVARRFGLTAANAPTHPSNCEPSWILRDLDRGVGYEILECGEIVACVGIEHGGAQSSFKHLAVVPEHRRRGLGRSMVSLALDSARGRGAESVRIGIIAQHQGLRDWYRRQGFVDADTKRFAHLPFEVLYLTHDLRQRRP